MEKNFPLESLILIGADSVLNKRKKCSFGVLVKECFTLFPEAFSLSEFPKWPDTLKLDRPLRKLKEKGYLKGNPNTHFTLTRYGESVVEELKSAHDFEGKQLVKKTVTRSPDLALINEIRKSKEFQSFMKNRTAYSPNNMSIRGLTNFTLETPSKTVSNLLNYLRQLAKKSKDEDLAEFLSLYVDYLREVKK